MVVADRLTIRMSRFFIIADQPFERESSLKLSILLFTRYRIINYKGV